LPVTSTRQTVRRTFRTHPSHISKQFLTRSESMTYGSCTRSSNRRARSVPSRCALRPRTTRNPRWRESMAHQPSANSRRPTLPCRLAPLHEPRRRLKFGPSSSRFSSRLHRLRPRPPRWGQARNRDDFLDLVEGSHSALSAASFLFLSSSSKSLRKHGESAKRKLHEHLFLS
jgi:hypothetical protein